MRILLVVAALLLAGCSDAKAPVEDDPFDDINTSKDKGIIRGIVIDPSITPVADATITLKGTDTQTRSNEEGAFVFTDLEPGPYFLDVSKTGFESVQASANVEAGVAKPPIIKVQMEPAPELVPFALPATYTGWIACESLIGIYLQPCDAGTGVFQEPDNAFFLPGADRPTDAIQVEVVWQPQQAVGERLTQTLGSCDGGEYCSPFADENFLCQNWGPSTLWCRVTALGGEGNGYFAGAEGLETQGHGKGTGTGVSVHLGADCSLCADPVAPSVGVGIVFEQEVTAYLWSFYNFEPDADWLFVEDGDPVPPGS